ncbi:hypothetical protein NIES4103_16060 [Nostoc sp. NIES-4103]|nr:hypothetical protein NIES4103_16060 [Nostoc sp. NIES-4103]
MFNLKISDLQIEIQELSDTEAECINGGVTYEDVCDLPDPTDGAGSLMCLIFSGNGTSAFDGSVTYDAMGNVTSN